MTMYLRKRKRTVKYGYARRQFRRKIAAKKIQRAWRMKRLKRVPSYRARAALQPKQVCETFGNLFINNIWPIKTLTGHVVVFPNETVTGITHNRVFNRLLFVGSRLTFNVFNNSSTSYRVHAALIQLKSSNDNTAALTDRFFKNPESTTTRVKDFQNGHASTDAIRHDNFPINSERFNVIWHKRRAIKPGATAWDHENQGNTRWTLKKYTGINKIVDFETPSSTQPNLPFYYVIWAEPMSSVEGTDPDVLNYELHQITFFRQLA